jgi:hypothetical protein
MTGQVRVGSSILTIEFLKVKLACYHKNGPPPVNYDYLSPTASGLDGLMRVCNSDDSSQ